jgi:glycosyltransferase involved in cell wall biosynthesis
MAEQTISIITVNLNNREGLERTLESVRAQTYTNYELIVIDGGSEDGSANILDKYANLISHAISEKDNGVFDAMNKGIAKASGIFCLFLNSGDRFADEFVLEKVSPLLIPANPIVYGHVFLDRKDENRLQEVKTPAEIDVLYMYELSLWHQATFIQRSLFERFGMYNSSQRFCSDWEFFLNTIIIHHVKAVQADMVVSVFDTQGSTWNKSNQDALKEERNAILHKYFNDDYIRLLEKSSELKSKLHFLENSKIHKIGRRIRNLKNRLFH